MTTTNTVPMPSFFHQPQKLLILILVIASCMRFIGLGHRSLWVDEVIASFVPTGSDLIPDNGDLSFIFWDRQGDVSPPLRDYIAHFCFRMFGVNEAALRFPSALFGVLSIWLIYLVGKKWFDEKIGLVAAILFTISPYHLMHSQGGRMYTVFIFISLVAFYCMYMAFYSEKRKIFYWFGFTLWNTLNIYLTYFGFWALITQLVIGITWIIWDSLSEKKLLSFIGTNVGKLMICISIMINLYLPWLNVIWSFVKQHIHTPIPYVMPFKAGQISKEIARDYMFYLKPDWHFFKDLLSSFGAPGIGLANFSTYIYLLLSLLGIYKAFQINKKIATGLILWLLVPITIAFAPPAKALFFNRYLSFMISGYLLLVAIGIWTLSDLLWSKIQKTTSKIQPYSVCMYLLIGCFFININPIVRYYNSEKQNWRDAVAYLIPQLKTGDIVVTGPYNAFWCVYYYAHLESNGDHDEIAKSKLGGEWCQLYLPGKTVGLGAKVGTVEEMMSLCQRFPRIWYISAYYRTYQYRDHAYYKFIESEFSPIQTFRGEEKDDNVYVFFHENPMIQPNPNIIWQVIK